MGHHHHYHSAWKRGLFSLTLILSCVGIGTVGFRVTEHLSYVDAFYLTSMIATAQGPTAPLATSAGKLFASLLAFFSVGIVVTAIGFLFGPFLGKLWRIGHEQWESPPKTKPK